MLAGLSYHFWKANIPVPTGDKIGKRPIDEHINGYVWMWYTLIECSENLVFEWRGYTKDVELTAYFAVSATLNLILWAAARKGLTTIKLAAFEPHIFNLIDLLRELWVEIDVRYDHTIIVHWRWEFKENISFEVISDYLQSGTFAIIGALIAKDYIDIKRARIADLHAFLYKLHQAGVKTEAMWDDTLRVYRAKDLKAVDIQTNIFPWFPTDLMPLFSVLMTQCEWTSRIHEILYEWRLNWLVEYERIGWQPRIINLHEAKISWPTAFVWNTVNSWDLRSGAAMVIAGLIASWETKVENIYWINRGYDDLLWKLKWLGADIEELTEN
jgi:UDP-N-acetylglucosamine 1-carboxyvinyltransferase